MSLTLADIARFNEADALDFFRRARWPETDGRPVCYCGNEHMVRMATMPKFRCYRCEMRFSEFSGGPFSGKKLSARDLLLIIASFATARKGISAIQLGKNLGVTDRTAWLTCQKLREVIYTRQKTITLSGVVEIDGAIFGGYRQIENAILGGFVKRYTKKKFDQRRVLCVARQRNGQTLTFVGKKESDCIEELRTRLAPGTIVQADGAHCWDRLKDAFEMMRINHSLRFVENDTYTNNAEAFFSVMRRQHRGTHHKVSGDLLFLYASEMAWRQDNRLLSAGELVTSLTTLAMNSGQSLGFKGYANDMAGLRKKCPQMKKKPKAPAPQPIREEEAA